MCKLSPPPFFFFFLQLQNSNHNYEVQVCRALLMCILLQQNTPAATLKLRQQPNKSDSDPHLHTPNVRHHNNLYQLPSRSTKSATLLAGAETTHQHLWDSNPPRDPTVNERARVGGLSSVACEWPRPCGILFAHSDPR